MKLIFLTITLFLTSINSFAFTEKTEFTCQNNEILTVTSSLMPNGERFLRANSSLSKDTLKNVNCDEVAEAWSSYGSENCYVSKDKHFSYYNQLGLLKIKINGSIYFTICKKTDSVQ